MSYLYYNNHQVWHKCYVCIISDRKQENKKAGQSPTCSPPGMCKRDCAFLTYLYSLTMLLPPSELPLKPANSALRTQQAAILHFVWRPTDFLCLVTLTFEFDFQDSLLDICMSSWVIRAASIFEITRGRTDNQKLKTIPRDWRCRE